MEGSREGGQRRWKEKKERKNRERRNRREGRKEKGSSYLFRKGRDREIGDGERAQVSLPGRRRVKLEWVGLVSYSYPGNSEGQQNDNRSDQFFEGMWTLGLLIRNTVECFK